MSLLRTKRYAQYLQGAIRRRDAALSRLLAARPPRTCVAMFHDIVADDAREVDEYACTEAQFHAWLTGALADGVRFLSLDALLNEPFRRNARGCCVLTFDDGFASLISRIQPLLTRYGVPYTAYITVDYLDQPGYLSRAELSALSTDPLCTIGSHSVSHPMFRFLPSGEARDELKKSKAALEVITGRAIHHFAFPYGSAYAVSLRDRHLAKACGYQSAALTNPLPLTGRAGFCLPRINMASAGAATQWPGYETRNKAK